MYLRIIKGLFELNQQNLYVHRSVLCSTNKRERELIAGKSFWETYIICVITTMATAQTSTIIIITTALTTSIILLLQTSVQQHINSEI